MKESLQTRIPLNQGTKMPIFGLGTFLVKEGDETRKAVLWALEAGYRMIDTAASYRNEGSVGRAIRESGILREEIFVTTKIWNNDIRKGQAKDALSRSLDRLKMDYVDLYLVHWPVPNKYVSIWEAMENLHDEGLTKAIGVSNYHIHHLQDLLKVATIVPAVNQVECHPYLQQNDLRIFCAENTIAFESWGPLMQGAFLKVPEILELANKYHRTPAQITLRWARQKDIILIPKSVKKDRIISNADIFSFEITPEDMKRLDALDCGKRMGPDPDSFNF
ncbi:MAG: aldo/keto reductase [Candidatus Marinimicrobia bacterium]|nr:aldo/keto reductase [Candidatus Neomarinimicrobiota bacterium]MDD5583187.1 aldo/keto reductase [Candidatus Neomarinimicrobiota bacterium]